MDAISGKVSVLIPLYNRKKYIEETVNSVLSQDYSDIELIVIDDGSSDGGDKLVEKYAADNKLIFLRQPGNINRGQSASLNLGLSRATGEFIAILDSDDLYAPGKIKKQVDYLKNNPEIGLVYGNGKAIDEKGDALYEINYDDKHETSDPNDILLDCYFLLPQNSLVRASVYKEAGNFDESLRSGQDHDMLVRIYEVTEIAHQSIDSFRYRRHRDSISANNLENRWRCGLIILDKAISRYPYKRVTIRKRRAVVNFRLAQALINKRMLSVEAFGRLLYAGILDPRRALSTLFNPRLMS